MRVVRCESPRAFLDRAEAFLLADEACHNVLLGAPAALALRDRLPDPLPYFAVVTKHDDVVAAAMMSPPYSLVLSRVESPYPLHLLAGDALAAGTRPPGVHGPVPAGEWFAERWSALTGQGCEKTMTQRVYRLTVVRPGPPVPGRLRKATPADRPMLVAWMDEFHAEAFGAHAPPVSSEEVVDRRLAGTTEGLYVWEHGGSRACAGYAGSTPHGIRVGPVYTPPEHRRHGYGSACVAALSQVLLDRGYRFCCLYADQANPGSNRIYQRLGYEPVCDVVQYRFRPGPDTD